MQHSGPGGALFVATVLPLTLCFDTICSAQPHVPALDFNFCKTEHQSLPTAFIVQREGVGAELCVQTIMLQATHLSGTNNSAVSSNYAAITKHWHHPFLI